MKPHPTVRLLGLALILSALVSLVSWGGSPTTPRARTSTLQPLHSLDIESPHSHQTAVVHALPEQYVVHDPISIKTDADFSAFGFPGEGSQSNPYVIEGLNIKAAKTLIHIQDTTAYFSIRNNLLTGLTGEHDGIYLVHVTHESIESNIIRNCKNGIYLENSGLITIAYNTISNCGEDGIDLWLSSGGSIAHNTISNCGEDGIELEDSRRGTTIAYNTISNCGENGIELKAFRGSIVHNTISNCSENGIELKDSKYSGMMGSTIDYNTISNCGGAGIRLEDSEARSVAYNTISNCGGAGIYFSKAVINTLVGNRLVNNGLVLGIDIGLELGPVSPYFQGTVADNMVNNRPLVFWQNVQGGTIPPGADQVILINTTGVEVTGQNLSRASTGLFVALSSNLNIHHNTLSRIHLQWSDNNTVAHNTVSQSIGVGGIYLEKSKGNIVANNTISQTPNGIYLSHSEQNIVANNTVSQSTGVGGIYLGKSKGNIVANNTVSQNTNGIYLYYSEQNIVANNTVSQNSNGIKLVSFNLEPNTVTHNTVSQNSNGIVLEDSGQHTVTHNAVADCEVGIQLAYSDQNIISHNTVSNCRKGIYLYETRQNTLVGNQLVNNGLVIEIYLPDRGLYPSPQIWPVEHYVQATVADNLVNGHPLVFWQNVRGGTVPSGAGQVILLNCTGVEVTGGDMVRGSTGVLAVYSSHLTIHHNTVSECGEEGIALYDSVNSTVAHNSIFQCGTGINLVSSDQNTLVDNTVSQCEVGIVLTATSGQNTLVGNQLVDNGLVIINLYKSTRFGNRIQPVEHYFQAMVAENVVNGRPLVFWQNVRGSTVPPGAGQVILLNCTGVEVTGGDMVRGSTGVFGAFCSHLAIHHNTFSNNSQYGIHFHVSGNSTIAHNTISECGVGIHLFDSESTTLAHNTVIQNNRTGIYLHGKKNTLVYNTVANNTYGMYLYSSGQNIVSNNTISQNTGFGIDLSDNSGNNTVSHNSVAQNIGTGIRIYGGQDNTIFHNTLFNNSGSGIDLRYTEKNTVAHNSIVNCEEVGIRLERSEQITVAHNTISHNRGYGIGFEGSKNTTVIHNSVVNNTEYGISLSYFEIISSRYDSEYNTVKGNDFLSNHPGGSSQAYDTGSKNVFARNYWDDHDTTDRNGDGITDAPYPIDGDASNQDLSPLTTLTNPSHSLSVPTLAYPNSSEMLKGMVTIQWAATIDEWEHSVTYAVSYSAGDVHPWILLASGLTRPRYEWNTTTVADGSAYRVQVVAICSDGLTAADVSDAPFTIQNPVVTTTVGAFPAPGGSVATLLVTLILLLAMHKGRRGKRQAR